MSLVRPLLAGLSVAHSRPTWGARCKSSRLLAMEFRPDSNEEAENKGRLCVRRASLGLVCEGHYLDLAKCVGVGAASPSGRSRAASPTRATTTTTTTTTATTTMRRGAKQNKRADSASPCEKANQPEACQQSRPPGPTRPRPRPRQPQPSGRDAGDGKHFDHHYY